MSLDETLLAKARAEAERLAEAERKVLEARAEYHSSVRRLHLAGGSFREVAEALGVSHQRIQQMVGGAGGSWWQRTWSSRRNGATAVCTFCQRPPGEVRKLVAGPKVYICDSCVEKSERAAIGRGTGGFAKASGSLTRCWFCSKRQRADLPVVGAGRARICVDCLRITREIMDHSTAPV